MFEKDPAEESLRKIIEDNTQKEERIKILSAELSSFPQSEHDDFLDSVRYIITKTKWTWKFYFKWYDGWIGYYWDSENKSLYLQFPFPWVGLKIYKETTIITDTIGV